MNTLNNFDWSITDRELVVLVPNFGRKKYIDKWLSVLSTDMWNQKDKWMVLIVNDGIHEEFDKYGGNVEYLTIERKNSYERGDGFSRNVVIKNSKAKLLAQKDPEIIYTGDFIKGCFEHQDVLYRCGRETHLCDQQNTELYLKDEIQLSQLKNRALSYPITEKFVYYHHGWCINNKVLKEVGGYDEDYKYYCFSDMDLHDRLMKIGVKQYLDIDCEPIHLWHQKPQTKTDPVAIRREARNKEIYESKKNSNIVRNIGVDWGAGDLNYEPEIV